MNDSIRNPLRSQTVIGTFTETWDAESAVEDLKFAGFDGQLRYVQHEDQGIANDTKEHGGFQNYFAKVYGFDDHEEYKDSACNFTVNPEAEEYFNEAFAQKHHVVLVQAADDIDKVIDTIRIHHGQVEVRHWAFFSNMLDDDRRSLIEPLSQPPRIHPTQAIEPPKDSTLI